MKTKLIGITLALAFGTVQAAFTPEEFKLDQAQQLLDICTAPVSHPDYLEAYGPFTSNLAHMPCRLSSSSGVAYSRRGSTTALPSLSLGIGLFRQGKATGNTCRHCIPQINCSRVGKRLQEGHQIGDLLVGALYRL